MIMQHIWRKFFLAFSLYGVCLLPLLWFAPALLTTPQLWLFVAAGMLTSLFQPAYDVLDRDGPQADRHTARQIVWTIYGGQLASLVECVLGSCILPSVGQTALIALPIAFGIGLRAWAVAQLGSWFTWHIKVQPNQPLIRTGPYKWLRHPSYTGAWLTFVGTCLLLGALISAELTACALWFAFRRRIRYEEAHMVSAFPDYVHYQENTGALFPRWLK